MSGPNSTEQQQLYSYDPASSDFDGMLLFDDDRENILDLHYESRSVAEEWLPISVSDALDLRTGVTGDFPTLVDYGKIPIFSARAWEALKPLIGYCCEALPIKHPSGEAYFLINVLEIIDALDEKRSIVDRNSVTGRISRVIKYSFHLDKIKDKHIFKLPLQSGAGLIVDAGFRDAVEKAGLRGLKFKPLPMQ